MDSGVPEDRDATREVAGGGGSPTSAHLTGCAADIRCMGVMEASQIVEAVQRNFEQNGHAYDELYLSRRRRTCSIWVHLSFKPEVFANRLRRKVIDY